jgi:hypothetical protein
MLMSVITDTTNWSWSYYLCSIYSSITERHQMQHKKQKYMATYSQIEHEVETLKSHQGSNLDLIFKTHKRFGWLTDSYILTETFSVAFSFRFAWATLQNTSYLQHQQKRSMSEPQKLVCEDDSSLIIWSAAVSTLLAWYCQQLEHKIQKLTEIQEVMPTVTWRRTLSWADEGRSGGIYPPLGWLETKQTYDNLRASVLHRNHKHLWSCVL